MAVLACDAWVQLKGDLTLLSKGQNSKTKVFFYLSKRNANTGVLSLLTV
jgi:hypothetical protein